MYSFLFSAIASLISPRQSSQTEVQMEVLQYRTCPYSMIMSWIDEVLELGFLDVKFLIKPMPNLNAAFC